jgi:myo-inositol-1(or 4)-monophosphatase
MDPADADLRVFLDAALEAATRAGDPIVTLSRDRSFEVRSKTGAEIVTSADLLSDQIIREHLSSRFPQHRFLSEEAVEDRSTDFAGPVWIVDPIDGTANYAHGHPCVAISIALAIDGEPCVGVVHTPFLGETYTATRGGGAWCNGRAIRVSEVSDLKRALIGTGFPHIRDNLDGAMTRVRRLLTQCQDIRRSGSPALDICWVAAGKLDAHTESLAPWDIAAATLIATEAGAQWTNLLPGDPSLPQALRGDGFLVSTPGIFDAIRVLLTADF